jgi:DNA polymerase
MPTLFWDFETRSAVSLDSAGPWRYASDPSTTVLCAAYAVDDGEPQIWVPGQPVPTEISAASTAPDWKVAAHNFMFERAIATRILTPYHGWPEIPLERQICTMSLCLANALPGKLETAAIALGLPLTKDRDGHRLMQKMSKPLPRRKNDPPNLVRWYKPSAEESERFHAYCKHDVAIERLVYHALPPLSPKEQALFVIDAIINQRGFYIDVALAQAARKIAHDERLAINAKITAHTAGEITSVDQIQKMLAFVQRHGHAIEGLSKHSVSAVLAHAPGDKVRTLLELRREGAKASARKLETLLASVDSEILDGLDYRLS